MTGYDDKLLKSCGIHWNNMFDWKIQNLLLIASKENNRKSEFQLWFLQWRIQGGGGGERNTPPPPYNSTMFFNQIFYQKAYK